MGTSLVPTLINALIDNLPGVVPSGVIVLDGYDTGNDSPSDFVMVGVEDPKAEIAGLSSSSQQAPATMGGNRSRDETGYVTCAATSVDGGGTMRTARTTAYGIANAIETWTRTADRAVAALGLPGLTWLGYGTEAHLLQDITDTDGAVATVVFRIEFKARI